MRKCCICGTKNSKKWVHKKGTQLWLCHKDYNKLYSNPRRLWFKGTRIYLKTNPRTGICSECGAEVATGEIKRTDIHHKRYYKKYPLRATVELCGQCHRAAHNYVMSWD